MKAEAEMVTKTNKQVCDDCKNLNVELNDLYRFGALIGTYCSNCWSHHSPVLPTHVTAINHIPVSAASDIAYKYWQDVVVITTIRNTTINTATFGKTPADKIKAANIADQLTSLTGATASTVHEDFRDLDAAKFKTRLDPLLELQRQLALLVGEDASPEVLLEQVRHWKDMAERYLDLRDS